MNIESKFEELEDMTINNDYVREKVTDLKNIVMETLSTTHNSSSCDIKTSHNCERSAKCCHT